MSIAILARIALLYSLAVTQHRQYAHPELICDVRHAGQTAGAQLMAMTLQKL